MFPNNGGLRRIQRLTHPTQTLLNSSKNMLPTTNPIIFDPTKKHDAIWLFDCTDGNPNGDPDADNLPRTDAETQHGLVSDVCLKRKVRNYVDLVAQSQEQVEKYKIYVQEGAILNQQHQRAYTALDIKPDKKSQQSQSVKARGWMCENFYDVRMFGAVMSTGDFVAGQVRGAVQMMFARSLSPVFPLQMSITRCAGTKENENKENKTMGRKAILPYGLYQTHVFFNPNLAKQTGVSENDLRLFWQALMNCWECDRSAARGLMVTRKLIIFSHDSALGNAPSHKLFELFSASLNSDVVPRSFRDYTISNLLEAKIPENITLTILD
jgi:CRISPR-associated protein Csd2